MASRWHLQDSLALGSASINWQNRKRMRSLWPLGGGNAPRDAISLLGVLGAIGEVRSRRMLVSGPGRVRFGGLYHPPGRQGYQIPVLR